jgi:hypothetical protein
MPKKPAMLSAPVLALVAVAIVVAAVVFESRDSSADEARAAPGRIVRSSDPIGTEKSTPSVPKPSWPGPDSDAPTGLPAGKRSTEPSSAEEPAQPCRLVSRSEAVVILEGSVSVSEGLQGSSCIYASHDSTQQVAVTVANAPRSDLRSRPDKVSRIQVGDRTGWCLHYGSSSLEVPLSDGRVLDVSGPCAAAARFAALAIARVPS